MRPLAVLFLLPAFALAAPASVSGGRGGGLPSSAPTTTMQTTQTGHGGGTGRPFLDPRQVPPLDPKREVTEQDCTKPIDLTRGNLKCK
ncbi:MAG TPA: hypothetical protein VE085_05915 [Burkholderiales bacterium]|nr:hypothetical protein [Burkholderiales bacterium]